mmetsp:Transcript_21069/g.34869  ORF Transcript_21069/g.34869 Transcript_21069/m.34869 type:complete len:697 (-) Transcript_21069:30-2120(-)
MPTTKKKKKKVSESNGEKKKKVKKTDVLTGEAINLKVHQTKKKEMVAKTDSDSGQILSKYADFPDDMKKLIQEHNKIAETDLLCFKGIRWFDQVWEIRDPKVLQKLATALSKAKERQTVYRDAVNAWTEKTQVQWISSKQFETKMLLHFPSQFQNPEVDLTVRVKNMRAAKACDASSRKSHIAHLMKGGDDGDVKKEKKAFHDGIEYVYELEKLKDIKMADPFFNKAKKAIGPGMKGPGGEIYEGMMSATKAVIHRAYEILDYGGTPQQVEKALQHLPPGFWPPMLVEDLQAWRHCERELIWEKINPEELQADLDMTEKLVTGADMKAVLGTIGDVTKLLGASGTVANAFSKVDATAINTFLKQLKHSATVLARVEKRCKAIDEAGNDVSLKSPDMRPEDKALMVAEISHMLSAFSVVKSIANTSPGGKVFIEQVCPGLAIFASAMETGVFAKAAYDCNKKRKEVKKELAQLNEIQGFRKNAMQYAFINEVEARERQTTEKAIHAVGRATSTVGAVATVAGGAAGFAVSITGKAIEVGNKIAFAGVDWKKAEKANKTINEARAGNNKARIKVFKHSNLYAKQYMAIMAKKGDPIALDYLQSRGLTEVDFTGPMSTKILRQALLKKAGQHDEEEDRNFMHNLAGKFLGPSLKKKLRKKKKKSSEEKGNKNQNEQKNASKKSKKKTKKKNKLAIVRVT